MLADLHDTTLIEHREPDGRERHKHTRLRRVRVDVDWSNHDDEKVALCLPGGYVIGATRAARGLPGHLSAEGGPQLGVDLRLVGDAPRKVVDLLWVAATRLKDVGMVYRQPRPLGVLPLGADLMRQLR